MNRLGLIVLIVASTLGTRAFPVTENLNLHFDPTPKYNFFLPGCFDSDPAAIGLDRNAHLVWARQRNAGDLGKNISYKTALLFNCQDVQGDALINAFSDISVIIANYAPNAACFSNDTAVIGRDRAAHDRWARSKSRSQLRDNLQWKGAAAASCMDPRYAADYFADVSVVISRAAASGKTPPTGQATPITWSTTLEKNSCSPGQRFVVACPSGGSQIGYLYGYGTYSVDSSICAAAVQMGIITFAGGGKVTFQMVNGLSSYSGNNQNGVGSSSGGSRGPCSFTF